MEFSVDRLVRFNQPKETGILKKKPEYFKVTEINLFDPNGEGQHLFLRVERKGLTTFEVCKILRRVFDTRPNSVGYAGLKDKVAQVIQVFSVKFDKDRLLDVETNFDKFVERAKQNDLGVSLYFLDNFRKSLNSKKLRSGLLKGNSFEIVIANLNTEDIEKSLEGFKKKLHETERIPNYYGEQRIGKRGKNAREGLKKLRIVESYIQSLENASKANRKGFRSYLKKRKKDNQATFVFDSFGSFQKFSAFQAALFNMALSDRILTKDTKISNGDKVISQFGGKVSTHKFDETEDENAHLTFALPLLGERVQATEYLSKYIGTIQLSEKVFSVAGLEGGYRPCLLHTSSMNIEITSAHYLCAEDLPAACVRFTLPKGAFATNVLREFFIFKEDESQRPLAEAINS